MLTYDELGHQVATALLPLAVGLPRVLAAITVVPMMSSQAVPMMARIAFSLSLALFLYPMHEAVRRQPDLGPMLWAFFALKEVLIGVCVGFTSSIFIWVVEGIGSLFDTLVGNNNLFLYNPMLNQETGPFSTLLSQFGAMLFIAFGGMIVLLKTLFASFVEWPALSFVPSWSHAALAFFIRQSADMLSYSVQLAMPVLTVLMLVDFGLGLLNRSASQLNAYTLSLPIKALVSVLFLTLTLVYIGDAHGPLLRMLSISDAFLRLKL